MDHIKELPALADNLLGTGEASITIYSTPTILDELKQYVFNGHVYPNFFELPTGRRPILLESAIQPGQSTIISEFEVIPIEVNHTVPTVGYIIKDKHSACLFSGDTYLTEEIWNVAATIPHLKAVFIETSFPNEMHELAQVSKHLTPALLAQEYKKIGRPDLPLYIFHIKPQFREQILAQLNGLDIPTLTVLEEGQEITL
jgi:cAMP phosphodiesterase